MYYLPLVFSAVMQYYAKPDVMVVEKDYRTEIGPTLGAVTGLLGAALGIQRNSPELEEIKSKIRVKYRVQADPSRRNQRDVRIMENFQRANPESDRFLTIERKHWEPGVPLLKYVEYIVDTTFDVFIGSDDLELLRTFYEALRNPVYPLYFGKKVCVPNRPLITSQEFSTISEGELGNVYDSL